MSTARASGSGAWLAAEGLATASASFLAMIVTARLIGPDAVGLAALALAFVQFAATCVAALFQDALVQRPELTQRHRAAAFWAALLVGAVGYGLVLLAAPWLARLLDQPDVAGLMRLVAPAVPCLAVTGYVSGLRLRAMAFRAVALRNAAGTMTGAATGIVLAMQGFGAQAPVLQVLVACALTMLLMLADREAWPRGAPGLREAGEILAYGGVRAAHQAIYQGYYRVFLLAAGTQLSTAALGQLHLAFRLVDQTRDLLYGVAWRFGLVRLSPLQHDHIAQSAAAAGIARALGLVAFPLFAGLAVTAPEVVQTLLGAAFLPMAAPLAILAAQTLLQFSRMHVGLLNAARGWPRLNMWPVAATGIVVMVATLLVPMSTAAAAALLWTCAWIVTLPVSIELARRFGAVALREQLTPALRPFALALGMAAVLLLGRALLPLEWRPVQRLLVLVAVGALLYLPASWFLARDAVRVLLGPPRATTPMQPLEATHADRG